MRRRPTARLGQRREKHPGGESGGEAHDGNSEEERRADGRTRRAVQDYHISSQVASLNDHPRTYFEYLRRRTAHRNRECYADHSPKQRVRRALAQNNAQHML
eukprot:7778107-Pyramimonas_sp.AAC.1